MKTLSMFAVIVTLGLSLTLGSGDAEAAKRLGGGKSAGMQKEMSPPSKAPAAAPAAAPTGAAAGAAAAQPKRSWMGPLAGLAAGIGLAALASHFGFGEAMANMMMIGLLIMAVLLVVGFIMRKRAAAQQPALAGAGAGAGAGNTGYQFSGAPAEHGGTSIPPQNMAMPGSAATDTAAPASASIPADFDVAGFVRNAKVHFIRLQAANDSGNLNDIREFTTPEMFAELKMNISERGGATQETDVVSINADVVEVAEEASRYVVSVRFTGLIREDKAGPTEPIDEIWHLVKPREGSAGWLLAGIQQIQ